MSSWDTPCLMLGDVRACLGMQASRPWRETVPGSWVEWPWETCSSWSVLWGWSESSRHQGFLPLDRVRTLAQSLCAVSAGHHLPLQSCYQDASARASKKPLVALAGGSSSPPGLLLLKGLQNQTAERDTAQGADTANKHC